MSFTKRQYLFFAAVVRDIGKVATPAYTNAFAKDLADAFELENDRFDRKLFIRACELPPEEKKQ